MMTVEVRKMNGNYAILTDENKEMADTFIDFLAFKQEKRESVILDAIKEYEDGNAAGPFDTVDELMADLYA
ncbi:MAG: hypothetical protein IJU87_05015 [Lachnospiraceae bacterium]|nr:hypothetical protein [Lachnospiraceae bacterium]